MFEVKTSITVSFLNFSYPYAVQKTLFLGPIFEMEIFEGFTHALSSAKSENHNSTCWLLCVCVSFISMTRKVFLEKNL